MDRTARDEKLDSAEKPVATIARLLTDTSINILLFIEAFNRTVDENQNKI